MFSLLVTVSLKKNVTMTVKVLGVVKDGSTPYVNNQVHNRTRLLSCAQVCVHLHETDAVQCHITLQMRRIQVLSMPQETLWSMVLFVIAA